MVGPLSMHSVARRSKLKLRAIEVGPFLCGGRPLAFVPPINHRTSPVSTIIMIVLLVAANRLHQPRSQIGHPSRAISDVRGERNSTFEPSPLPEYLLLLRRRRRPALHGAASPNRTARFFGAQESSISSSRSNSNIRARRRVASSAA